MDYNTLVKELKSRMDRAIDVLHNDFKGLRTGRASASFLDPVIIEAYGSRMHINQLGTVSTPDATTVAIQVWDKGMVKPVEKAIVEANLGVSPSVDGSTIRLHLPALSEERRKEIVKLAHKYTEEQKVAVRNVRRDAMDQLKKMEKEAGLSEDDLHRHKSEIDKITEEYARKADDALKVKEKEVLSI